VTADALEETLEATPRRQLKGVRAGLISDRLDEGGHGRSKTARRGSLDGPGSPTVTMEKEARQGFLVDTMHSEDARLTVWVLVPMAGLRDGVSNTSRSGPIRGCWGGDEDRHLLTASSDWSHRPGSRSVDCAGHRYSSGTLTTRRLLRRCSGRNRGAGLSALRRDS
jgi:hypothetical protein